MISIFVINQYSLLFIDINDEWTKTKIKSMNIIKHHTLPLNCFAVLLKARYICLNSFSALSINRTR